MCKPTAPKFDMPQALHMQDEVRGAGLQDLLQDWVTQPTPPTAALTPQFLCKRVAMAAHDTSEGAMRDSQEIKHQLLWAMPVFLIRRMPHQHETNSDTARKPSRAEGIKRLEQRRLRVQKGEHGMWTDLLLEAPQERETRTDEWKTPSRLDTSGITKRRTQEAAARKDRKEHRRLSRPSKRPGI